MKKAPNGPTGFAPPSLPNLPGQAKKEDWRERVANTPPAPDLREFTTIPLNHLQVIQNLVALASEYGFQIKQLEAARKPLIEQLKLYSETYNLDRFQVDGVQVSYYNAPRKRLDPIKLVEHGVKTSVIEACTTETDSWTLRVGGPSKDES